MRILQTILQKLRIIQKASHLLGERMSTFVARVSPITGKQEWVQQAENYDYVQEIARSAYADMLHDTERNKKYYAALRDAIKLQHERGKQARVLDIGTGTGLLSMMAVVCGADTVTALEAFQPMAACAHQVIKDNGFSAKIKLIPKRSTEVTVGPGGDIAERANILVTEVFDTELIGEGAIGTFHHAHAKLLQKDCIVVPSAANMFVQVVQSDFLRGWNQFLPMPLLPDEDLQVPADVEACEGAAAVHDLQLQQLHKDKFVPISEPVQIFRFDYSGQSAIEKRGYSVETVSALCSGRVDAVLMWWELEMDTQGKILLSCAPGWSHPQPSDLQWRDHWMQAIYYPPSRLSVTKGDHIDIEGSHDDYSLWFNVCSANNHHISTPSHPPACRCGAHVACSRTRVGMLNDRRRHEAYMGALKKLVKEDSVCLCLSDGSLLPVMAAKLGCKNVYCLESHPMTRHFTQSYVASNHVRSRVSIIEKQPDDVQLSDFKDRKLDLLIAEPFFTSAVLPWHNLFCWYARTDLDELLAEEATVMPHFASIRAVAVQFDDLWKIRAPVGMCEGFDLTVFDKMIEEASDDADAYIEPQPLWEYPGLPLTDQFDILNFDLSQPLSGIRVVERDGVLDFNSVGTCHGVAVWMEYALDVEGEHRVTTGLLAPPVRGENLQWDPYTRQGVHLFKQPLLVEIPIPSTPGGLREKCWRLKHKVVFHPKTGDFEFDFKVIYT